MKNCVVVADRRTNMSFDHENRMWILNFDVERLFPGLAPDVNQVKVCRFDCWYDKNRPG